MNDLIARMEQVDDIMFEIEKRLGANPIEKLDKIITRMDTLEQDLKDLKKQL
jgi:multidrug efflux pump subunit AcrB